MPRRGHFGRNARPTPLPGEGDMDLWAYIPVPRDAGFDGGMALDLYAYDYEAVAGGAVAYLKELAH